MAIGNRMRTPMPDRETEMRASGSGPVTTYTLSPEQIAALPASKHIERSHRRPIPKQKPKEEEDVKQNTKVTKEQYLALRSSGLSRKEIAKQHGYSLNHLEGYWLMKWGIKDPDQEELAMIGAVPPAAEPPAAASEVQVDESQKLKGLEVEQGAWAHLNQQLAEAKEDAAEWKRTAEQRKNEVNTYGLDLQKSRQEVAWLEEERASLLETLEQADEKISRPYVEKVVSLFETLGTEIGALVAEKNAAYGDSFAKTGDFLQLLYPVGIQPEQYGDALCLVRIYDKLMRIATRKDAFGESPYRDIVGYGILGAARDNEVELR